MTWKNAFHRAIKEEMQPMHQVTHWTLFLAIAASFALITLQSASAASYDLIEQNPDIAGQSWLVNGMF